MEDEKYVALTNKVTELLQALADQLGTTMPYLWEVLIRQVYVENTIDIIKWVLILIVLGVISKIVYNKLTNEYKPSCGAPPLGLLLFCLCVVDFFIFSIGFDSIAAAAKALLNPDFVALQRILNRI